MMHCPACHETMEPDAVPEDLDKRVIYLSQLPGTIARMSVTMGYVCTECNAIIDVKYTGFVDSMSTEPRNGKRHDDNN